MNRQRPAAARASRAKQGFTLVELLCAIVVLLLVSALMVTGIQLGIRALNKSVSASEARVLCSTLQTTVSDELRYAGTTQRDGNAITFFSQNYSGEGVGFSADEEGHVLLGEKKLLPNNAYPHGLRATVQLTDYDSGRRVFSVAVTVTNASGTVLAETAFEVRQLNEPAVTEG